VQYRGGNVDGLSGIVDGVFEGADTYSLFSDGWQEPGELVGKGYVWSELSLADKIKLANNPDNNIYRDGEKWIQVRYRIRVVKGLGNEWRYINAISPGAGYSAIGFGAMLVQVKSGAVSSSYSSDFRDGGYPLYTYDHNSSGHVKGCWANASKKVVALPIALVQRRNAGIWHETFNPEGCARVYVDGAAVMSYLAPEGTITSLADCFDHDLIATIDITDPTNASRLSSLDDGTDNPDTYKVTGTIESAMSGRPDGLYVDEVNERDVEDLRMSAHKRNYDELREEYAQKALRGEIRGKEKTTKIVRLTSRARSNNNDNYFFLKKEDGYDFLMDYLNIPYDTGTFYLKYRNVRNAILINRRTRDISYLQHIWYNKDSSFYGLHLSKINVENRTTSLERVPNVNVLENDVFDIYLIMEDDFVNNGTSTHCDIVGDPRKLADRIKLDITEDTTQTFTKNDYVLCTDTDNNNGDAGHYYRYLSDTTISNVHTNTTDGDANATDGHIDFSDDAVWLDLGDDGSVGGYTDTWLEHGVSGYPLLVDEEGGSMLPVDAKVESYDHNNRICLFGEDDNMRLSVKASRKGLGIEKFLVKAKDDTWVPYAAGGSDAEAKYYHNSCDRLDNRFFWNIEKTLDKLGYSSLEEALDLMVVKVYYKMKTNFLKETTNRRFLNINNSYDVTMEGYPSNGVMLIQNFLNKLSITSWWSTWGSNLNRLGTKLNGIHSYNGNYNYLASHDVIMAPGYATPFVKFRDYLSETNKVVYLTYTYNELKNSNGDWGDNGLFNVSASRTATMRDDNGEVILFGQKSVRLPYFVK